MYKQLRDFRLDIAGNVKGYCLRNVRLGYGIGAKYATAWQAWQNSPQQTGAIPSGVEVPVYFWYGRDGHIGVQLADGTFWSDGKIYSSLAKYRLSHPLVMYRGWSTQVNGLDVIQYVPDPVTPKMPPVGSRVRFAVPRTAFVPGTTSVKGTLPPDIRLVRGYDPKYPYRILVNSALVGNGVAVALYTTAGAKIDGWSV